MLIVYRRQAAHAANAIIRNALWAIRDTGVVGVNLMPNPNYKSGRAFEYETQRTWEEKGYQTIRASGSHGPYDVIAFRVDRKPELIQCKVCNTEAEAKRLLKVFVSDTIPSLHYHQAMTVKVRRKMVIGVTV